VMFIAAHAVRPGCAHAGNDAVPRGEREPRRAPWGASRTVPALRLENRAPHARASNGAIRCAHVHPAPVICRCMHGPSCY